MKAPDIPGSAIIHSQGVPTGRNPTLRDIVHCSTLTDVSHCPGDGGAFTGKDFS